MGFNLKGGGGQGVRGEECERIGSKKKIKGTFWWGRVDYGLGGGGFEANAVAEVWISLWGC